MNYSYKDLVLFGFYDSQELQLKKILYLRQGDFNMPKIKTRRSAAKRFSFTKSGLVKRAKANIDTY